MSLKQYYKPEVLEAGCDEAGRGCLAGPVFAAAVILPSDFEHHLLNDSKKLSAKQRETIRSDIEKNAIACSIASVSNEEIDELNIFKASILAMHRAVENLGNTPQHLIIDGKFFYQYKKIPHQCIIKGDQKYLSIAAASVLAKTYRDDFMREIHNDYPEYQWISNKGYPTDKHRRAIREIGISPHHRKSFRLLPEAYQLKIKDLK